jgi:uncharacterized protein with ParB-like and HNH nuclease domain
MPFIRTENFTSIYDIFTKPTTVFIIPSFQRPFAWENKQLEDLLNDMAKAQIDGKEHYLSALHLTEVSSTARSGTHHLTDSLAISDFLDSTNPDIQRLKDAAGSNCLFTKQRQPLEIYAVVDGQQRLTTLYLLACQLSVNNNYDYLKEYLRVTLNYGNESIPKLIQNPSDDHNFLQKMIAGRNPSSTTSAQRRMEAIYKEIHDKQAEWHHAFEYFSNHQFKASVILLDSKYGLRSFLTLNDRGKKLTVLEKLKSFLMERAIDIGDNELLHGLHKVFGKLYQVLDKFQEEKSA